jgi:RNA polymerase sigma-70 factor (ECF subfamily)
VFPGHVVAFAWAVVWKLLARYRLGSADRADVAQEVILAAYLGRATYDPERGSPQQWLSGIARREVQRFRRRCVRSACILACADLPDEPDGAASPEEDVTHKDLAVHLVALLPPPAYRILLLIEVEGLTFREVAEREGIALSTVCARRRKAMAALEYAVARSRE